MRQIKNRRHHSDIRQVCAAVIGIIQHIHISRLHPARIFSHHGFDRFAHRAQMHRHMWRIGNQASLRIKQGAAEIQPLFDIHRVRCLLQSQTHLLGNRHEEIVKHLQHDWVHHGANGVTCFPGRCTIQHQMILCADLSLPLRLNNNGRVLLCDDGRAGNFLTYCQRITFIDGRCKGSIARCHGGLRHRHGCRCVTAHGIHWWRIAFPQHFDRNRFHYQTASGH